MIHESTSSFYEAQTREFILEVEEQLKLGEILTRVYVQRIGKPLWVVFENMFLCQQLTEAQAYGIVDLVALTAFGKRNRDARGIKWGHSKYFDAIIVQLTAFGKRNRDARGIKWGHSKYFDAIIVQVYYE
ncbi:Clp protease proteolytic subunit [Forsythia ovata]|uniref:Clp protease proteolytic subunit n=1 Tax=Forsythia ovata TaxID=205694 RepID=A0ABD1X2C6_9LAMI